MTNLETDRFVCGHCEKVIRYERPLFCPYCGEKLDTAQGLEEQDGKIEIYGWSQVAPALVWLLTGWMVLVLPASYIWGRKGFTVLSILFAVLAAVLSAISLWTTYSSDPPEEDRRKSK